MKNAVSSEIRGVLVWWRGEISLKERGEETFKGGGKGFFKTEVGWRGGVTTWGEGSTLRFEKDKNSKSKAGLVLKE